jgi:hypothetical protein
LQGVRRLFAAYRRHWRSSRPRVAMSARAGQSGQRVMIGLRGFV